MSKENVNESLYPQSGVAMTCRSFNEYCSMFMLDNELPKHGQILDVAAGASSFTAELRHRGYQAFACDPLYELSPDAMHQHGLQELELASQKLAAKQHAFVWKDYASLEAHDAVRRQSLEQFIHHYRKDKQQPPTEQATACYVAAKLPKLPFPDHTFELVLCNHFLFLYQEQFDYSFHLQAILEMLRITKQGGKVLLYPLVGFRNELYPQLDQLQQELVQAGAQVTLRSTAFRFLPAADSFLQVTK